MMLNLQRGEREIPHTTGIPVYKKLRYTSSHWYESVYALSFAFMHAQPPTGHLPNGYMVHCICNRLTFSDPPSPLCATSAASLVVDCSKAHTLQLNLSWTQPYSIKHLHVQKLLLFVSCLNANHSGLSPNVNLSNEGAVAHVIVLLTLQVVRMCTWYFIQQCILYCRQRPLDEVMMLLYATLWCDYLHKGYCMKYYSMVVMWRSVKYAPCMTITIPQSSTLKSILSIQCVHACVCIHPLRFKQCAQLYRCLLVLQPPSSNPEVCHRKESQRSSWHTESARELRDLIEEDV